MDEEHWLLVEIDIDDHSGVTAFGAPCRIIVPWLLTPN